MKQTETKCEKCCGKYSQHHNSDSSSGLNEEHDQSKEESSNGNGDVSTTTAIARCVDCDQSMCMNCLIEHHQLNENASHKLQPCDSPMQRYEAVSGGLDAAQLSQSIALLNEMNANSSLSGLENGGELLAKINETMKASLLMLNASHSSHLNEDDDSVAAVSSPMEKKRDCQVEFLSAEDFLKVDDLCQENVIKRRHSNLDRSEFESSSKKLHHEDKQSSESSSNNELSGVKIDEEETGTDAEESKVAAAATDTDLLLNEFESQQFTQQFKFSEQLIAQQQQQQQQNMQYQQQQQLVKWRQQGLIFQQQQQQQNNQQLSNGRLVQIEAEINKTFNFYVQILKERKEYLVKELNTIVQFALLNHSQSINKQVQVQYQLELKKQQVEKELNDTYDLLNSQSSSSTNSILPLDELNVKDKLNLLTELNNLIMVNNQLITQLKTTNPLMSIEFISNYSAIQTSIRNTFGFIRINHQQQASQAQQQQQPQVPHKQQQFGGLHFQDSSCQLGELNVLVDNLKPSPSISYNQSTVNNSNNTELINSPISITAKKQHSSSALPTMQTSSGLDSASLHQWKSSSALNGNNHNDFILGGNANSDLLLDLGGHRQQQGSGDSQQAKENPLITLSAGSTSSNKSVKSNSSSLTSSASSTHSASKFSPTYNYLYDATSANPTAANMLIQSGHITSSSNHSAAGGNHHHMSSNGSSNHHHRNSHHNHHQHLVGSNSAAANGNHHSMSNGARMSSIYDLNLKNSIQLTRSKMIYHCKFGEFGINDGQFTEPSGVTINTNNDIIVADTNSHRIQIFDREGNFKFKFGECGKRDGQLLYPNRVSIVKHSGDIVVTERSPTHQIQIYNKYGVFLRKFGATILQHPRGVCVDYKGRIVVVECKVMRVIIFDLYGNVLNKFNCSKYLEFPNGVCCSNPTHTNNFREEIYISDNRAHCIKVFDYQGNFLRQIGGEGITNYPIGVGINCNNEILVADNHNNFNLTVFTQDGKLINALESKVKHAQCFDVGLMDDGSIVLASKDYRIYVYKYSPGLENCSMLASPTSSSVVSSTTSNSGQVQASAFPSHSMLSSSSARYELFSETKNSNGGNSSSSSSSALNNLNAGTGLYNYFKSASINVNDNILQQFSELNDAHVSSLAVSGSSNLICGGQPRLSLFGNHQGVSSDNHNFLIDSASSSANVNDISQNESNSLLNLSTNTTNTNNIVSNILNGIL